MLNWNFNIFLMGALGLLEGVCLFVCLWFFGVGFFFLSLLLFCIWFFVWLFLFGFMFSWNVIIASGFTEISEDILVELIFQQNWNIWGHCQSINYQLKQNALRLIVHHSPACEPINTHPYHQLSIQISLLQRECIYHYYFTIENPVM